MDYGAGLLPLSVFVWGVSNGLLLHDSLPGPTTNSGDGGPAAVNLAIYSKFYWKIPGNNAEMRGRTTERVGYRLELDYSHILQSYT
jgi:hypothetical protein